MHREAEHRFCSTLCLVVDTELANLERVARATMAAEAQAVLTESWSTLVSLSDTASEYARLRLKAKGANNRARHARRRARLREVGQ
jgi:DNA-binding transcriptional regulator WhiA